MNHKNKLGKIRKWMQSEADVELFSCVHAISMVFLYGLELFIYGTKAVPFVIIFEMFLLGYFISWIQKLLFFKEKVYSRIEFRIKAIFWSVGPVMLTAVTGRIFSWYEGLASWVEPVFIGVLLTYYLMIWVVIKFLYRDETDDLNEMLSEFKMSNHLTMNIDKQEKKLS